MTPGNERPMRLAYVYLVLAPLFWSGNWVAGRALRDTVNPVTLNTLRWSLALIILAALTGGRWGRIATAMRREWRALAGLGVICIVVFQLLLYYGLRSTTAVNGLMLNSTMPVWMVAGGVIWLGERAGLRQVAGGLVSAVGILSRDSLIDQRIDGSVGVHGFELPMDGGHEMIGARESAVGEVLAFECLPAAFDVVEFGGIFGQPFRCEPVAALSERGHSCLAGVDRPVVEDDPRRFARLAGLRAIEAVDPFEECDDVTAPLASRGFDDEFAGNEIERPDHGDLLRLARRLNPQIGSTLGPSAGKIGMGEGLGLIGKQQDDVACQRLLLEQLHPEPRTRQALRVLPALQRVAGPLAGIAPFLRSTTESREREMRWPVRRSISSESRGSVQFARFSTGRAKTSPATAKAASAFTGTRPGAGWRTIASRPSRMNAERQLRTVSSRTRKASPISRLFQPDADNRMPRARSASSRFAESASRSSPSRCSSVTISGDLSPMIHPPNQRWRVNHCSIPLASHRSSA